MYTYIHCDASEAQMIILSYQIYLSDPIRPIRSILPFIRFLGPPGTDICVSLYMQRVISWKIVFYCIFFS